MWYQTCKYNYITIKNYCDILLFWHRTYFQYTTFWKIWLLRVIRFVSSTFLKLCYWYIVIKNLMEKSHEFVHLMFFYQVKMIIDIMFLNCNKSTNTNISKFWEQLINPKTNDGGKCLKVANRMQLTHLNIIMIIFSALVQISKYLKKNIICLWKNHNFIFDKKSKY